MRRSLTFVGKILLGCVLSVGAAQATLFDRGGGLIYDDVLDVTWLQDVQYARTSGASVDGRFDHGGGVAWADSLQYFDTVRGVVWDDWRLPQTFVNDLSARGFDTAGATSELAYMYYINLGYSANPSFNVNDPNPTSSAYNPFVNLVYLGMWSGTETPWSGRSWAFHWHFGYQDRNANNDSLRVWAVRDGDVGLAPAHSVPEPTTLALFGVGLGLLGVARRRKSKPSI